MAFDFLERILKNMAEHPARNAFFIRERWTSYGELAGLVSGVMSRLDTLDTRNGQVAAGKDAEPSGGSHAAIWLADDIHTYASILALWMSGKAFVPVNPLFPEARNRKILEQVSPRVMLHSGKVDQDLLTGEHGGCRSLFTGDLEPGKGVIPRLGGFDRDRDAYVLFTSGSTGNPKGVRISFRNLNAFVRDFTRYPAYNFTRDDRFLQIYDLSFDASAHCNAVALAVE
jgi:D-alanine--poly(phosphoribitol) ligase subunit 1